MNAVRYIIDKMADKLCSECGESASCEYGVEYSEEEYGYLLLCLNPLERHTFKIIISDEIENDEIREFKLYGQKNNK